MIDFVSTWEFRPYGQQCS